MVEIVREIDGLGFDEYTGEVEEMLEQRGWEDPLNKLRVGVTLTFSLNENRNEQYVSYPVDELSSGNEVFLIRPAWLNKGYDFKVCVEGWDDSSNPAPSHDEIYSDLYWKRENDDQDSFDAICSAVMDIHEGLSPTEVIEEYGNEFDFSVGRKPEALLKPLPWLFIEQDIRYWNYTGRDMTIELIKGLQEGEPLSELELEPQELEDIHSTPLSISD
jgi:hypothetical protein